MSDFFAALDARIARYDLLQHPFYQAWSQGELHPRRAARVRLGVLASCLRLSDIPERIACASRRRAAAPHCT